ncbi:MAG: glucosyl transferase [Pseudomonadota bacterium]
MQRVRQEHAAAPACLLSVVVPVFNEQPVLAALHARLAAVATQLDGPVEFLFVDDGSTDASVQVLAEIARTDPRVGVIRFSRNFGKEQAMSAGLRAARGEAVVILDADLQHPPEHIPDMVAAWRAGADLVNMKRRNRDGDSWVNRQEAALFYALINRLRDTPIPRDVGDFRLISRRAVNALNQMPERGRFMKGLLGWIGFPQVTLHFDVAARAAGTTRWTLTRLVGAAMDGITAYSIQPLKAATQIGLLTAAIALGLGVYYLIQSLFYGDPVPGFPTLVVIILMLGGVQLVAIGVLGEYLGRMWLESKGRPLYIVQDHQPPRQFASADTACAKARATRDEQV